MTFWLNGERIEGSLAGFDLADRGLLLSDGVFETALVLGGRVAYRDAHLARLAGACATLGFAPDMAAAAAAMDAAAFDVGDAGSVRLTVTRGAGPRGLVPPASVRPTLIAANAAGTSPFDPLRLWVTPIRRNETSPTSRLKTLNYLDAVLALAEARRRGFDEVLFLNGQGRVACAGTGNVFALTGDVLATPPAADGVLPGIVRALVLRLAAGLGLQASETSLDPRDLMTADAVFVTNSLRLVSPVTAVGDRRLATTSSAILRQLAGALRDDVTMECGVHRQTFPEKPIFGKWSD